jgi:formylmethanofuran dehydrogenase subunit D
MRFIMNTGRSIKQGVHVKSKYHPDYAIETSACFMNPLDMFELGIDEGDNVLVTGEAGRVVMKVVLSEEVGEGSIFIPFGPYANYILHPCTHSTGMPDFKSCDVEIEPTAEKPVSIGELMSGIGGRAYEG